MLQAYRRGFLKPDYPNGLQSRIREEMILMMMGREQDADYIDRQTLWSSVIAATHLKHEAVRNQISRMDNIAKFATRRRHYSNAKYISPEDSLRLDGEAMAKALKDFENSAMYDVFTKKFAKIRKRLGVKK